MSRVYLIIAIAAMGLFNYAQYQGWSLFSDDAKPEAVRNLSAARAFHK
jgi:hypothetical protein